MGKVFFVAFPAFVLVVSILMQGGNLTGTAQNVCFNQSNSNCAQNGNQVTQHCPGPGPGFSNYSTCKVSDSCTPPLPSPAYCFFGQQVINPGDTIVYQVAQVVSQGVFNFGAIGSAGFVAMISVAIAVAVLSGVTILGSGLNQESVHILFMGGLLVGIWAFLASLEGFIGGSSLSFFTQVNTALIQNGNFLPFGTVGYVAVSLMELYGIISFVSRGGV